MPSPRAGSRPTRSRRSTGQGGLAGACHRGLHPQLGDPLSHTGTRCVPVRPSARQRALQGTGRRRGRGGGGSPRPGVPTLKPCRGGARETDLDHLPPDSAVPVHRHIPALCALTRPVSSARRVGRPSVTRNRKGPCATLWGLGASHSVARAGPHSKPDPSLRSTPPCTCTTLPSLGPGTEARKRSPSGAPDRAAAASVFPGLQRGGVGVCGEGECVRGSAPRCPLAGPGPPP